MRAGTENVPAIVGFGAAASRLRDQLAAERVLLAGLQERLEAGLLAIMPQTVIFGAEAPRVPNTTLFAVPGVRAETALIGLDLAGFAVSSGSACSSGKVAPSHVLAAMGAESEVRWKAPVLRPLLPLVRRAMSSGDAWHRLLKGVGRTP